MKLLKDYTPKSEYIKRLTDYIKSYKDIELSEVMGIDIFKIRGLTYSYENEVLGFSNSSPVNFNAVVNNTKTNKVSLKQIDKFKEEILDIESLEYQVSILENTPFIKIHDTPLVLRLDKKYFLVVCFSSAKNQYFCKFEFEIE
jgi:hypothetical protein